MKTFPSKKRINTDLFVGKNIKLYILLVDKGWDQENILIRKMDHVKIDAPLGEGST